MLDCIVNYHSVMDEEFLVLLTILTNMLVIGPMTTNMAKELSLTTQVLMKVNGRMIRFVPLFS
jgi:hypothetical protein